MCDWRDRPTCCDLSIVLEHPPKALPHHWSMQSPDRANLARVAGPDRRTRVAVYHRLGSACCSPWTVSDLFVALVRTWFCSALERRDVVPRILIIQHVAEAKSDLDTVWHCIPYRPHSLGSCGRPLRVGALSSNPGYHQSRSQGVHSKTSPVDMISPPTA